MAARFCIRERENEMSRDFRHDTEAEPNMRTSSPVSALVERLNGENPDKVVATDRLRMYAHDPDTFEFDQNDALSLIPIIEEAATTLTTLSTHNAELEREVKRLMEAMQKIIDAPLIDHSNPNNNPVSIARDALSTSPQGGEHE